MDTELFAKCESEAEISERKGSKARLEETYRRHHTDHNRYGYLYCHGERVPYLKKWIGTGKRVLDLGCRDGQLTASYVDGNQVVGVDIDRAALEIAQQRLSIETRWLDLNTEWPFAPESFDVIFAGEILEHLYFLTPFLENLYFTLKPGGLFIGSVPNTFRLRNRLKFLAGYEFECDPTHVRMFSRGKLQSLLSLFFSDIEIIPIRGKVLPGWSIAPGMPYLFHALFAKDLLWRSVRKERIERIRSVVDERV